MSTKTKTKTNELPKWFKGEKYTEGDTVTNPFSGESCELNNVELSMYDFIMGCQFVFERSPNRANQQLVNDFHKGLDWFRKNNAVAYMTLLD
jgi:hypothetical protein